MLSVQPLKSARGAADYYTAAFNYYSGDAQAMKWLGNGCKNLNLSGEVQKEQMLSLLKGELPDGTRLQDKQGRHRPGFDMTFSAPKSVSILVGLGADPRLVEFHDKAVEKAIARIEKEFAQTRIVKDGKTYFINTESLIVAAFRQPSSRANDPALHTHGVTMNITFDEEGKPRSLASDILGERGVVEQLQRSIKYAGLVYRTELANFLKGANYPLTATGDGLFEISGMPEEVLKEFSKRREEIEKDMEERGVSGAAAASKSTLRTRPDKEEHDIDVLKKDWLERAEKLNFNAKEFVQEITSPKRIGLIETLKDKIFGNFYSQKEIVRQQALDAVEVGIETISQETSVFSKQDLVEKSLKHVLIARQRINVDEITQVIDDKIKEQSLYVGRDPYTDKQMLTTPWQLTIEAETLSRIESNKNILKSITTKKHVIDAQKTHEDQSGFQLTPSQKSAMVDFLTCKDRFMAIQGYAGTGKTTMLKLTQEIANEKGMSFRGLAITSSAANELSKKAGVPSDVFPVVYNELVQAKKGTLENKVFLVDEASMLSTPQGHKLVQLIEKKGGRLYVIGDDAQLPSVNNGRIFGLSQEYGIATSTMDDIIRQKNIRHKEAVEHAMKGEVYDAVQKTTEVREIDTHDNRIEYFAKSWLHLSPHVREQTLLFAPTHKNRTEITSIIREGLLEEGSLGRDAENYKILKAKDLKEVQWHHARYYNKGDVIRFNVNIPRYGIKSGDYLTVNSVKEQHIKNEMLDLSKADGKKINFKLSSLPKYMTHNAGLNRYLEVYEQTSIELREKDIVLWTKNFKKEGITNSETATIAKICTDSITLKLANGKEKTLNKTHDALKHMDHGYVLTNMKAQGKDKFYAIGLVESYNKFAATIRNYYVQISRGIQSISIITDDKTNLIKALSINEDEKKSAIDHISKDQLENHNVRFSENKHSLDLENVINKKNTHELAWKEMENTVEQYRNLKEQGLNAKASKLAYQIVQNKKLYKLAKSKLGFHEGIYRHDAIKVAHLHHYKSLTINEKNDFNLVKSYVRLEQNTKKAWKKTIDKPAEHPNYKAAFDLSSERNQIAYTISRDIGRYKKHLHMFSIGQSPKIGLSQHLYAKEDDFSLKKLDRLIQNSQKHEIKQRVLDYFDGKGCKLSLAEQIKSDSKNSHPHIIALAKSKRLEVSDLWKNINDDARIHSNNKYKKELTAHEQSLFDKALEYKNLGLKMKDAFENGALNENSAKSSKLLEGLSVERNKIGYELYNADSKSANKVLSYFKIDKDKLSISSNKHTYRKNVLEFKNTQSDFKQTLKICEKINQDLAGHYPYIKELNVSSKKLNKYISYINRQEQFKVLSDAQVIDYKKIIQYKYACKQASKEWQETFKLREMNKPVSIDNAMLATAKRNKLATEIESIKPFNQYIKIEHIDTEKLLDHARSHHIKVDKISKIALKKSHLLNRLSTKSAEMSTNEADIWRKDWRNLMSQEKNILKNKEAYIEAINETPSFNLNLSNEQKILIDKYDLPHNTDHNRTLQLTKKVNLDVTIDALMSNPEHTYRTIFGEPKKVSSREMRYSGGLVVTLKGRKAGLWFDFTSQEGGNPINAIMREQGCDFKEALMIGAQISNTEIIDVQGISLKSTSNHKEFEKSEQKNKIKSAQSVYQNCVSPQGTLAEKYLKEHRKIPDITSLNVKYWPKGAAWLNMDENGNLIKSKNKIPALVIPAYDEKGQLKAVQRIYLDEKTGGKNTFMGNAKLSKGLIKGSAGVIQKGEKDGRIYIAEGPETGASIASVDKKSTVITSFGLSNIQNISEVIKSFNPSEVIIAGDNDSNSKVDITKQTLMAADVLKENGIDAKVIFPEKIIGQSKTDWNDVLKYHGEESLKNQLEKAINENHKSPDIMDEDIKKFIHNMEEKDGFDKINKGSILDKVQTKSDINLSISKELNHAIEDIINNKKDINYININKNKIKDIDLEL